MKLAVPARRWEGVAGAGNKKNGGSAGAGCLSSGGWAASRSRGVRSRRRLVPFNREQQSKNGARGIFCPQV